MVDPLLTLRPTVENALREAFGDLAGAVDPGIHRSAHADYQVDAAMALARRLKKSPREVATAIVARLPPDEVIASAAVSGPGFINLALRDSFLAGQLRVMLANDRLGVDRLANADKVVIDYSSPNLAKEMHAGHLRSTIIGDALARLLTFLGHEVIRQNHIGDWGTPFGMLIELMLDQNIAGNPASLRELSTFYRDARARFDSDPGFADRARRRVVLLQSSDPATLALWQQLIDLTLMHLEALYAKLGVQLTRQDVVGESFFNDDLPGIVAELEAKGIANESDGAICAFPPGFQGHDDAPIPLIVRKSDGGFGYGATDLAAVRYRVGQLGARQVLYVVGSPQQQHLAMVFAVAGLAGWAGGARLDHVAFGSVLGSDKKMLKSRAGAVVTLDALLDGAVERARTLVDDKSPDLDEGARAEIAKAVGVGAVKYADMVNDRTKDYVFDWNRMLAFDGNTAPYLMYANARIRSILRKAEEDPAPGATPATAAEVQFATPAERSLALELLHFPNTVVRAADGRQPHHLCQYLFDLASAFSGFYETSPVLKADPGIRQSRLALCRVTAEVLATGLGLLGIAAPDKM